MSRNRKFTDELALKVLNREIKRCEKTLQNLEIGAEDYGNVFMELRMYQIHKQMLMKNNKSKNNGEIFTMNLLPF